MLWYACCLLIWRKKEGKTFLVDNTTGRTEGKAINHLEINYTSKFQSLLIVDQCVPSMKQTKNSLIKETYFHFVEVVG